MHIKGFMLGKGNRLSTNVVTHMKHVTGVSTGEAKCWQIKNIRFVRWDKEANLPQYAYFYHIFHIVCEGSFNYIILLNPLLLRWFNSTRVKSWHHYLCLTPRILHNCGGWKLKQMCIVFCRLFIIVGEILDTFGCRPGVCIVDFFHLREARWKMTVCGVWIPGFCQLIRTWF